jgi:multiple sugar transport system ATP-binding protein
MLELDRITRTYGRQTALSDVTVSVPEGSFTALLGPSGCGKTTTLRIMAGLDHPTRGTVRMNGQNVFDLSPAERNVAMVFQSFALYPHMSVADNIALPLAMRTLSRTQRAPVLNRLLPGARWQIARNRARVREVAELLEITDLLERKPGTLSGGQKQRVAVARALVRDPSAFLLDEPLSNLDAKLRVQMRGELMDLHRRTGRTFVYVTHDQAEAMSMADQVIVMMEGRVVQSGPPRRLYESPQSTAVAAFLGDHPINWVDSEVTAERTLTAFPRVALTGRDDLRRVRIGLRPEALEPGDTGPLMGSIERIEYLGSKMLITVRTDQGDILRAATTPDHSLPESGSQIRMSFDPAAAHVFDPDTGARVDASLLTATSTSADALAIQGSGR